MSVPVCKGRNQPLIYVAGHRGMVGAAVVRHLQASGTCRLILQSRSQLDLTDQQAVRRFFFDHRPDAVVFAAARVGGIHANATYPAEFIQQNLVMAANAIHSAWESGTSRFLFLGSTCIYPRLAPQPIQESSLLTSSLEPTNEAYAIAKIAGVKMCQFYRQQYGVCFHSAMPTNLYGPGDNYHPENSHVIPGMIRRFHEARCAGLPEVAIWGTGTPMREFLHVDDLASALIHLLSLDDPPDLVNIGSGEEHSIRAVAELVAETVGYSGRITQDLSRPDGTPRKLSDISVIRATGWSPRRPLRDGLASTYQQFLEELDSQAMRSA